MPANKIPCNFKLLDCQYATSSAFKIWEISTNVFINCSMIESVDINYGIFIEAVKNRVAKISFSEILILPCGGDPKAEIVPQQ
jgi:hypothetical protein